MLLVMSLLAVALPSGYASAACKKSNPATGLICGEDIPDYPGWRRICSDGCVLTTLEDERLAQKNRKLAFLVPRLRVALEELKVERDFSRSLLDYQVAESARLAQQIETMEMEAAERWSPMTWTLIGAGSTLLGSLALAFGVAAL
jgi:predicted nucleic acid-binding Zn ribbon protein